MSSKKVCLLVGTHKGGFLFTSDLQRKKWQRREPFFKGVDVHYLAVDNREAPTIYACVNSTWWGPDIRYSNDFCETWKEPSNGIRFDEDEDVTLKRTWCVVPGRKNEPGVLYAGVDPAALFKTEDHGKSWFEIPALRKHATRDKWFPGFGGLMVHSICLHPANKDIMHVGISAAGTFSTEDGGTTWQARNKGVQADFLADKFPEVGQCVHHMESHPARPDVLYQQNHCGVYRSDNAGKEWTDLGAGLPSRFGFPLVIHPHDPDTIYVVPEEGAENRCVVGAELAVYRSRNRGGNWQKLSTGMPSEHAYLNVLRHAMATDTCDSAGIYFGTNTGQLFYSRNEGDHWELLANFLPPIHSVSCAVI